MIFFIVVCVVVVVAVVLIWQFDKAVERQQKLQELHTRRMYRRAARNWRHRDRNRRWGIYQ